MTAVILWIFQRSSTATSNARGHCALAVCRAVRVLMTNLAEILNSRSAARDRTSTWRHSVELVLPALLRHFLQPGVNLLSESDVPDTQQMEPEHTFLSSVWVLIPWSCGEPPPVWTGAHVQTFQSLRHHQCKWLHLEYRWGWTPSLFGKSPGPKRFRMGVGCIRTTHGAC